MECPICLKKYENDIMNEHIDKCIEESANEPVLTPIQEKAVKICKRKSMALSKQVYHNIVIKAIDLNHNEEKVKRLLDNFSDRVELIINFKALLFDYFTKDGVYKNCFEINPAVKNINRISAENNLFLKAYDECSGSERVKYGSLNLFNLRTPTCASYYGECFMILKENVKKRTSFCCGDSFDMQFQIGTIEYATVILNILDSNLLDNLIKYYNNEKYDQNSYINYVEIQIHGPIRFDKDVELIVVPKINKDTPNLINFLKKFNIKCVYY
jgi:hypothetical protein